MKSGSDGIESEHLETDGLVETGDGNWEQQLKLKDDEMSCLLMKLQTKERKLNKKNTRAGKSTSDLKKKEVPERSLNY